MFCKFSKEKLENLQRYRVRTIEKRRGSPNAYLIIPKILIFRRIYRKVHEPSGSLKTKEKPSKSLIIKHYQGFLFSGR